MSWLKLPLYCWGRQVTVTTVTAGAPEGAPLPPSHTHLEYSHLGRQQKTSDNWWAPWGLRAADSLMEPSLSSNYIYKADGARMKETRVPDRGAESFIRRRQQLNCDVTPTPGIKIQHVCPDFTVGLSPLLFSPASVSYWDEICCLLCISLRFKITGNNLCAGPQAIFFFSSSLIVFINSSGAERWPKAICFFVDSSPFHISNLQEEPLMKEAH